MRRNNENHRLDVVRNITDLLGRTFSSQFVFPVLGHEDGQGNNFRRLGELWRHWLPSEALQTFEKGKRRHNYCKWIDFCMRICASISHKKKERKCKKDNRQQKIKNNGTTQTDWTHKRLYYLNCTYSQTKSLSADNPDWFNSALPFFCFNHWRRGGMNNKNKSCHSDNSVMCTFERF